MTLLMMPRTLTLGAYSRLLRNWGFSSVVSICPRVGDDDDALGDWSCRLGRWW